MKSINWLIVFICAIICMSTMAGKCRIEGPKNYYFSSSEGDDSRTSLQAQDPATPWQTIGKLNKYFVNISPGDSILLKRGDVFYGYLKINKSGEDGKPIVISAYGEGKKPVISGFSIISSWTPLGNNIYEVTLPNNKESVNCVVIEGKLQPIGRYPKVSDDNGGYLTFESHSGDGQITDEQLSDKPNWTGGEVVIRKNHWIIDRSLITSHIGSIINFIPVTTFYKLLDKSGYFIQNHPLTLTQNGDWCFDPSDNKLMIYYTTTPPEVKVSTIDELLTIEDKEFIDISGIGFEGANRQAVNAKNIFSLSMTNCCINFSGFIGAQFIKMRGDYQFNNNSIFHSLNNALSISSVDQNSFCTIKNNVIINTGMIVGMGGKGDGNYMGVNVASENGATIEYNVIKNTGYVPLSFNGNNILIKNNVIDNYLMVKQDGGGIYTWNGGNPVKEKRNRVVIENIVSNGIGNADGTVEGIPRANGIYMDNNVNHVDILNNTVFNISGIGSHNNSPSYITIKENTFFNVGRGYNIVRWLDDGSNPVNGGQEISELNIQNNIFFAISGSQLAGRYSDRGVNFPAPSDIKERISSIGIIDNNYYHLPNGLGFGYTYRDDKSSPWGSSQPLSLDDWRELTGFEKNSKLISIQSSDHLKRFIFGNLDDNGQLLHNLPRFTNIDTSVNHDAKGWELRSKIIEAEVNDQVIFVMNASKNDTTVFLNGTYFSADNKIYEDSLILKPFNSVILMKIGRDSEN